MQAIGVIPARYNSSRFPGKPLCLINGISMIERVYNRVLQAEKLSDVVVATDDERIFDHVLKFNGKVVLTSSNHQSGTDRCYQALNIFEKQSCKQFDIIINIQGDEPFIEPSVINELVRSFEHKKVQISTMRKQIHNSDELFSPNVVKVVCGNKNNALYFSRQAIPHIANLEEKKWVQNETFFKHIGIYAFRTDIIRQLAHLKMSVLEQNEKLEQLRWLENGYSIFAYETNSETYAVDIPNDVEKIEEYINKGILK